MVKPLTNLNGVTHWAAYEFKVQTGFKRTNVYRIDSVSPDGTIYFFKPIRGGKLFWQPASMLSVPTFRPFAYLGGRSSRK